MFSEHRCITPWPLYCRHKWSLLPPISTISCTGVISFISANKGELIKHLLKLLEELLVLPWQGKLVSVTISENVEIYKQKITYLFNRGIFCVCRGGGSCSTYIFLVYGLQIVSFLFSVCYTLTMDGLTIQGINILGLIPKKMMFAKTICWLSVIFIYRGILCIIQ